MDGHAGSSYTVPIGEDVDGTKPIPLVDESRTGPDPADLGASSRLASENVEESTPKVARIPSVTDAPAGERGTTEETSKLPINGGLSWMLNKSDEEISDCGAASKGLNEVETDELYMPADGRQVQTDVASSSPPDRTIDTETVNETPDREVNTQSAGKPAHSGTEQDTQPNDKGKSELSQIESSFSAQGGEPKGGSASLVTLDEAKFAEKLQDGVQKGNSQLPVAEVKDEQLGGDNAPAPVSTPKEDIPSVDTPCGQANDSNDLAKGSVEVASLVAAAPPSEDVGLKILRSMSEMAQVVFFCQTFRGELAMPAFSRADLEFALLHSEDDWGTPNKLLAEVHYRLSVRKQGKKDVDSILMDWEEALVKRFREGVRLFDEGEELLDLIYSGYQMIPFAERVHILDQLCNWRLDDPTPTMQEMLGGRGVHAAAGQLRVAPLGEDDSNNQYWYFNDECWLYAECENSAGGEELVNSEKLSNKRQHSNLDAIGTDSVDHESKTERDDEDPESGGLNEKAKAKTEEESEGQANNCMSKSSPRSPTYSLRKRKLSEEESSEEHKEDGSEDSGTDCDDDDDEEEEEDDESEDSAGDSDDDESAQGDSDTEGSESGEDSEAEDPEDVLNEEGSQRSYAMEDPESSTTNSGRCRGRGPRRKSGGNTALTAKKKGALAPSDGESDDQGGPDEESPVRGQIDGSGEGGPPGASPTKGEDAKQKEEGPTAGSQSAGTSAVTVLCVDCGCSWKAQDGGAGGTPGTVPGSDSASCPPPSPPWRCMTCLIREAQGWPVRRTARGRRSGGAAEHSSAAAGAAGAGAHLKSKSAKTTRDTVTRRATNSSAGGSGAREAKHGKREGATQRKRGRGQGTRAQAPSEHSGTESDGQKQAKKARTQTKQQRRRQKGAGAESRSETRRGRDPRARKRHRRGEDGAGKKSERSRSTKGAKSRREGSKVHRGRRNASGRGPGGNEGSGRSRRGRTLQRSAQGSRSRKRGRCTAQAGSRERKQRSKSKSKSMNGPRGCSTDAEAWRSYKLPPAPPGPTGWRVVSSTLAEMEAVAEQLRGGSEKQESLRTKLESILAQRRDEFRRAERKRQMQQQIQSRPRRLSTRLAIQCIQKMQEDEEMSQQVSDDESPGSPAGDSATFSPSRAPSRLAGAASLPFGPRRTQRLADRMEEKRRSKEAEKERLRKRREEEEERKRKEAEQERRLRRERRAMIAMANMESSEEDNEDEDVERSQDNEAHEGSAAREEEGTGDPSDEGGVENEKSKSGPLDLSEEDDGGVNSSDTKDRQQPETTAEAQESNAPPAMAEETVAMAGVDIESLIAEGASADKQLSQACLLVVTRLLREDMAVPFSRPVDPELDGCPDYFDVIRRPIDLGTISDSIRNGYYQLWDIFKQDLDRVWNNCRRYNESDSLIVEYADTLDAIGRRVIFELEKHGAENWQDEMDEYEDLAMRTRRSQPRRSTRPPQGRSTTSADVDFGGRHSRRKTARVSYYEGSSEEEGIEEDRGDVPSNGAIASEEPAWEETQSFEESDDEADNYKSDDDDDDDDDEAYRGPRLSVQDASRPYRQLRSRQ